LADREVPLVTWPLPSTADLADGALGREVALRAGRAVKPFTLVVDEEEGVLGTEFALARAALAVAKVTGVALRQPV